MMERRGCKGKIGDDRESKGSKGSKGM